MKPPTIEDAKHIAQQCGLDGAIVLGIAGGKFAVASYGKSKAECDRMKLIADQVFAAIKAGQIITAADANRKRESTENPANEAMRRSRERANEAIEQAMQVISMTDDLPEAGWGFGESVADKCRDIIENIEKHGRVTQGQQSAIDNMEDGVSRWLHD